MSMKVYIQQILEAEVKTWGKGDWVLEEDGASGHGKVPQKAKKKKRGEVYVEDQDELPLHDRLPLGIQH